MKKFLKCHKWLKRAIIAGTIGLVALFWNLSYTGTAGAMPIKMTPTTTKQTPTVKAPWEEVIERNQAFIDLSANLDQAQLGRLGIGVINIDTQDVNTITSVTLQTPCRFRSARSKAKTLSIIGRYHGVQHVIFGLLPGRGAAVYQLEITSKIPTREASSFTNRTLDLLEKGLTCGGKG